MNNLGQWFRLVYPSVYGPGLPRTRWTLSEGSLGGCAFFATGVCGIVVPRLASTIVRRKKGNEFGQWHLLAPTHKSFYLWRAGRFRGRMSFLTGEPISDAAFLSAVSSIAADPAA